MSERGVFFYKMSADEIIVVEHIGTWGFFFIILHTTIQIFFLNVPQASVVVLCSIHEQLIILESFTSPAICEC